MVPTLEMLRKKLAGPKGWLATLPGWGVLVLAVWWPQSLASDDHLVLAVLVGLVLTALWVGLVVVVGITTMRGLIGAGFGVAEIALMHAFGSGEFQAALALDRGRSLDGVTLAEVMARREDGIWVRITDARVRSDATRTLQFVSGGGRDSKGSMRATTTELVSVAPVVLASEVPHEQPLMRGGPSGVLALWACADQFMLSDWDSQRQAVRGRLAPMEERVRASLAKELAPAMPEIVPGAGAVAAAPGASEPTTPILVPRRASLPADPWCVHLDRALDAATARTKAVETVVAVGLGVPLFLVLFVFLVARTPPDTKRR